MLILARNISFRKYANLQIGKLNHIYHFPNLSIGVLTLNTNDNPPKILLRKWGWTICLKILGRRTYVLTYVLITILLLRETRYVIRHYKTISIGVSRRDLPIELKGHFQFGF